MSSETLEVKKRQGVGTRASQRLRAQGLVPANLYGHGEANVNLAVRADTLQQLIHHGTKLVSLTGDITDTALLREVQWDAFGIDVLHVDMTRVSTSEAVEVTLPIELHGEAAGTRDGGVVNFVTHELTIRCPADELPEHLHINLGNLQLGQAIHAREVALPAGATMITHESTVVVQVVKPSLDQDEEGAASVEPELIRKERGGESDG